MGMLIGEAAWVPWVYGVASAVVVGAVLVYAIWGRRYGPPPAPTEDDKLYDGLMREAQAEATARAGARKAEGSEKPPGAVASEEGRET